MTSTPRTTRRTRSRARALALTLAAATAATAVSAGLSLAPSLAHADPGDTFVALGSSQLLQSEDLASDPGLQLDTETVVLNRDEDFSACLGEGNRWSEVLPGSPAPVTAVWSSRSRPRQSLQEWVAQAATPAQAKRYATILLDDAVRGCQQGSQQWDFYYGPTRSSSVGSGSATWALSYPGSSKRPDGGVVVVRKGREVGLLTVSHPSGSAAQTAQTVEALAKEAVHRLV